MHFKILLMTLASIFWLLGLCSARTLLKNEIDTTTEVDETLEEFVANEFHGRNGSDLNNTTEKTNGFDQQATSDENKSAPLVRPKRFNFFADILNSGLTNLRNHHKLLSHNDIQNDGTMLTKKQKTQFASNKNSVTDSHARYQQASKRPQPPYLKAPEEPTRNYIQKATARPQFNEYVDTDDIEVTTHRSVKTTTIPFYHVPTTNQSKVFQTNKPQQNIVKINCSNSCHQNGNSKTDSNKAFDKDYHIHNTSRQQNNQSVIIVGNSTNSDSKESDTVLVEKSVSNVKNKQQEVNEKVHLYHMKPNATDKVGILKPVNDSGDDSDPKTLSELVNNKKILDWFGDWTEAYTILMMQNIDKKIKDEVEKQMSKLHQPSHNKTSDFHHDNATSVVSKNSTIETPKDIDQRVKDVVEKQIPNLELSNNKNCHLHHNNASSVVTFPNNSTIETPQDIDQRVKDVVEKQISNLELSNSKNCHLQNTNASSVVTFPKNSTIETSQDIDLRFKDIAEKQLSNNKTCVLHRENASSQVIISKNSTIEKLKNEIANTSNIKEASVIGNIASANKKILSNSTNKFNKPDHLPNLYTKINENTKTHTETENIPSSMNTRLQHESSISVDGNTIYGNTVGGEKITNVFIFYPNEQPTDVLSHLRPSSNNPQPNINELNNVINEDKKYSHKDKVITTTEKNYESLLEKLIDLKIKALQSIVSYNMKNFTGTPKDKHDAAVQDQDKNYGHTDKAITTTERNDERLLEKLIDLKINALQSLLFNNVKNFSGTPKDRNDAEDQNPKTVNSPNTRKTILSPLRDESDNFTLESDEQEISTSKPNKTSSTNDLSNVAAITEISTTISTITERAEPTTTKTDTMKTIEAISPTETSIFTKANTSNQIITMASTMSTQSTEAATNLAGITTKAIVIAEATTVTEPTSVVVATTVTESTTFKESTTVTESTTFKESTTITESTTVTEATTISEPNTITEVTNVTEAITVTAPTTDTEETTVTEVTTAKEATTVTEPTNVTEATTVTEPTSMTEVTTVTQATTITEATTVTEAPTVTEVTPVTETITVMEASTIKPIEESN